MPRDVSLSDSKCWNGGYEWVNPDVSNVSTIDVHFRFLFLHDRIAGNERTSWTCVIFLPGTVVYIDNKYN